MQIHHIALRVRDLEKMKIFYTKYFGMEAGSLYRNPAKGFSSCFLSSGKGTQIELIHQDGSDKPAPTDPDAFTGFIHVALSAGNRQKVDQLTEVLRKDGYTIAGDPRMTGDGYYESVILDPEGNRVEIIA